MKHPLEKFWIKDLRQVLWNLGLIAFGSALCAVAINGILIPREFLSAGFVGLALVIYYFVPVLPVAWLYFLLNVPLFIIGWRFVGRRFFLYSLAGMVIFSCAVEFIQVPIPVQDKILSALLAGIITGTGAGVILRSIGSAGGLDILCVIMLQRFSVRLGTTSLAFNSILLVAGALLFSLERALYTLIYIYVASYILNLVVTGLSQRKAVFIISSQWEEISKKILYEIDRGLTIIKGQGGYTGQEEQIVYTVITFREYAQLKGIIKKIDPKAFMVVTETLDVMGQRIGTEPHW
ncbi:MAG: YitT family protein [Deltaproteobacteria bacterium]|nr:MAG: YitT family protein [Deltaproteobacteria bacterium]